LHEKVAEEKVRESEQEKVWVKPIKKNSGSASQPAIKKNSGSVSQPAIKKNSGRSADQEKVRESEPC
jgi:hypothetical protein